MTVARRPARALLGVVLMTALAAVVVSQSACGGTTTPSSSSRPSSTPGTAVTGAVLQSPTSPPRPQPAPFGAQGDFHGAVALRQPAGRAVVAYLQARASAAVTPKALASLAAFFVPVSSDIAWETYLARGKRAQWVQHSWPPASNTDRLEPSSVSLTVTNQSASFEGYATDMTTFASGRSDQEGEGLQHTVELKWLGGRWLVQRDAYVSDTAPGSLEKGGAPRQMVAAAIADVVSAGPADPTEVAAAVSAVRDFVRLVSLGRYAAAQRLVRAGSRVSAQELGREVASLKLLRADFVAVPANTSIELQTSLRVKSRPGSGWSSGVQRVYFTVTRERSSRVWQVDDYSSAP